MRWGFERGEFERSVAVGSYAFGRRVNKSPITSEAYHYCEYAYGRAVGEKILGYIMPVYADQQGPVELAMVYGRTVSTGKPMREDRDIASRKAAGDLAARRTGQTKRQAATPMLGGILCGHFWVLVGEFAYFHSFA